MKYTIISILKIGLIQILTACTTPSMDGVYVINKEKLKQKITNAKNFVADNESKRILKEIDDSMLNLIINSDSAQLISSGQSVTLNKVKYKIEPIKSGVKFTTKNNVVIFEKTDSCYLASIQEISGMSPFPPESIEFLKLDKKEANEYLANLTIDLTDNKLLQEESEVSANHNNSEPGITSDFNRLYKGLINNKYEIEVLLKNSSGQLSGNYRYVGKQAALDLVGTIDQSGNFSLKEYDNAGKNTGSFIGQLINGTIQGTWNNSSRQKSYSFSLTEINQEESIYQLLQGKWQSEDDPKSYIIFDKFIRNDIYDGQSEGSTESYVLANNCTNNLDKNSEEESEKDKFISLLESDMCFHIDYINSKTLSLVDMSRGNFLNYKKVE